MASFGNLLQWHSVGGHRSRRERCPITG